jgi:Fe-S-cluster containining protein
MPLARPRIALKVLGEEVVAEADVPAPYGRLDELLPFMLALDQAAIDVAVRKNPSGKTVSCAKGCSACCRAQPVPVTPPEAFALWKLVESFPEARRAEVRERFANRVRLLDAAGLKATFLREAALASPEAARAAVERYVALGLVCPFLDEDACSIHPVRPFVCRQYLVTSSPDLCRDPLHQPVEIVPMPLEPAHATLRITEEWLGMQPATVPLVLALEFAERHRSELEQPIPTKDVLGRWLQQLVPSQQ